MAGKEGPSFTQAILTVGAILALMYSAAALVLSLEKRAPAPQVRQAEFVSAHTQLTHPLGFAASVRQCAYPRPVEEGCDEPRYYMTKAREER